MKKLSYSDKPLIQRIVFFLVGFTDFILGYGLYYLFKNDKDKEWQIEFIHRGAQFGLILCGFAFVVGFITGFISGITG